LYFLFFLILSSIGGQRIATGEMVFFFFFFLIKDLQRK
jgi:hypothetical protein